MLDASTAACGAYKLRCAAARADPLAASCRISLSSVRLEIALRRRPLSVSRSFSRFTVWEQNLATVRALSCSLKQNGKLKTDFGKSLVAHLKSCAIALVNPEPQPAQERNEVKAGDVKAGCEKNGSTAASEK